MFLKIFLAFPNCFFYICRVEGMVHVYTTPYCITILFIFMLMEKEIYEVPQVQVLNMEMQGLIAQSVEIDSPEWEGETY